METSTDPQAVHDPHALRGPHFGSRLAPEQRAGILRWLDETEHDPDMGVRELAQFVATWPVLERAVIGTARSAYMGGAHPSSTTHAVALLGLRLTRRLIRSVADVPARSARSS